MVTLGIIVDRLDLEGFLLGPGFVIWAGFVFGWPVAGEGCLCAKGIGSRRDEVFFDSAAVPALFDCERAGAEFLLA